MKNLKKVLALVVVLTMVLGTVAFASFTDVTEENDAYTAVQTLSSLEILNGYDDGSFKPEGNITRAEFCAVVCRALGLESQANGSKGTTIFSDVPADHWASGYINLAAGQKIVNGMGDGTFAPESNVTYEQAVKMLVVALGYEPMAASKGGWPAGYLVVANQYGMTKNVKGVAQDGAATRGTVAQLVYNALPIAVMEQTGFGTQTTYTIMDGSGDYDYKSLLTGLDIAKIEGRVVGTSVIAYDGSTCDTDEVVYSFNEVNDDTDWEDYLNKNADKEGYADYTFKVNEGVNADDYFGISSIIYAKKLSSNKYTIVAIMPGDDSQVVSLGLNDLDADTDYSAKSKKIVYYPTAGSSKTSSYTLSDNAKFYYNYESIDGAKFLSTIKDTAGDIIDDNGMEITLIENTGDSKYDMVIMKEYTYAVIDTVEADRDRFTTKDGTTYTFDFDDDTISNKIMDKDGAAINLEDFAEDDVVGVLTEKSARKDFKWCDIINLGQNVVTGTVTEVSTADSIVRVDGTKYDVVGSMPKNGDEGTFYLTNTGKIFYYDLDSSVSGNYAYILEAGRNTTGFSTAWQVKLLTKENGIVTYDVNSKFKVNGTSYDDDAATVEVLTNIAAKTKNQFKDLAEDRIITFKLNSDNEIKEIKTKDYSDGFSVSTFAKTYKKDTQTLGKSLEDDTVIFDLTSDSPSSAYAAKINYLVDDGDYEGYMVKNADDEYDCVVITKGESKIDLTSNLAVVTGVTDYTTDDEKDAWVIRYVTDNNSEEQSIVALQDEDDTSVEWDNQLKDGTKVIADFGSIGDLPKGSVIMFAEAGDGTASAIGVIAIPNNSTLDSDAAYYVNKLATDKIVASDDDNEFVFGYIVDWTSKSGGKSISYAKLGAAYDPKADYDTMLVKGSTNSYTYYNKSKNSVSITTGMWDDGKVDKYVDGKGSCFIARLYNGAVKEFIGFNTRKDVTKLSEAAAGLASVKASTPAKAEVVEEVVEEVKEPTADSDIAVDVE